MSLTAASHNLSMSSSARLSSSSNVSIPWRSMNRLRRLFSMTSGLGSQITSPITTGCTGLIVARCRNPHCLTTLPTALPGSSIPGSATRLRRSSRRRRCWTTSACAASSSYSRREFASRTRRSRPTSCGSSASKQRAGDAEPFLDSGRVLDQKPVIVPRGAGDRQRDLRPGLETGGANGLVLRVAPAVPGALDGRLDELDPLGLLAPRSRQAQHLPLAVLADECEQRLAARPACVASGAGVFRVGRHESLL